MCSGRIKLAAGWGLDSAALGPDESGAMVDDGAATALPLPDRTLAAVGDEEMRRVVADDGEEFPLGEAVAGQLSHTSRHLDMIGCLKGVQGLRGTATV